ncbi:MAG: MoaD/ThiS family protein [Erysipelotrichales bacterium]|nr:MoaD/ThiS family protein [Erysipelotrichales bacterium]
MIEIRLFATFRENRKKIDYIDSNQVEKALDIVNYYGIDPEDVAICLINGFHSKLTDSIKDGDVVALFPPVGGG